MTIMTNQQAPEALRPIQRFNNVAGLMNPEARGLYVRYEDHVAALVEAQQPAPSAAAAGQRRSDLVPGVMHCAKCKFQLSRVTLCVSDGNAYAGNNETEPCPNGCGPLWPVTWEQEARNCWKALEEMHERLHPAPTTQADSQPAAVRDYPPLPRVGAIGYASVVDIESYAKTLTIGPHLPGVRDIALWTTDQMRAYVDADRAARAPADSVTAPAAYSGNLEQELAMLIRRIVSSARRNCEDGSNVLKLANEAWAYLVRKGLNGSPLRDAGIESDPTPAAHAADSVLEDAAFEAVRKKLCALPRYSFALDSRGNLRRCEDKSGNWIEFDAAHALFDPVAVDAARKQGGAT